MSPPAAPFPWRAPTDVQWAVDAADSTWGRVEDVLSTAARHTVNNIGGLGLPGLTWNVRDAYRTHYNDEQRLGGAIGDAATLGVAALLVQAWRSKRFTLPSVFGLPPKAMQGIGLGMLAIGSASGIFRSVQNAQDDGDLSALGTTAAVLGAALATRGIPSKILGKVALFGGVLGAGVAGHWLGSQVRTGPGHIGEPSPESRAARLDGVAPVAAARGFWNHFVEAGPVSQGASLGKEWGQVQAMRGEYSDSELVGGMLGDAFAATLVGTGAMVVGGRILNRPETARMTETPMAKLGVGLSIPARIVASLRDIGALATVEAKQATGEVARIASQDASKLGERAQETVWTKFSPKLLKYDGKVPQALYLVGAGLLLYSLYEAWDAGENGKNKRLDGPASVAVTGAGILGAAGLIAKWAPMVKDMPRAVKPGVALITASAIAAAVNFVREPVGSYVDGADELSRRRGGAQFNAVTGGLALAGGVGGALLGARAAQLMTASRKIHIGGGIAGAAVGAAAAWGLAPFVSPGNVEGDAGAVVGTPAS